MENTFYIRMVVMEDKYVVLLGGRFESNRAQAIELLDNTTRLSAEVIDMPNMVHYRDGHSALEHRGRILVCGGDETMEEAEMFISENDRFRRDGRAYLAWSPVGQWTILMREPPGYSGIVFMRSFRGYISMLKGTFHDYVKLETFVQI